MYKSVAVVGGDKRQLYCADAFFKDGYKVFLGGFDKLKSDGNLLLTSPLEAMERSDFVIFPLPCIKGDKLNAVYSSNDIYIDEKSVNALKKKKIFCGQKEKLLEVASELDETLVYDYSKREEFSVLNAVATAEGALEIAMREFEGTINNSRCLVCGYGRIGKVLSDMLLSLHADVTVSARKRSDLAWIESKHLKSVHTKNLDSLKPFDIIFNTVPALILDSKLLSHIARNAIVIDLASIPGGVDFESAGRMSILAIHALSLPGKVAPKSAGEIIKNTITNMLEEDDRCQKNA